MIRNGLILLLMLTAAATSYGDETEWAAREAEALELANQGQLDEALEKGEEALAFARALFGEDDVRTSDSVALLGEIHMARGEWGDAEKRLGESKAIRDRVLPPLDFRHEQGLNLLGRIMEATGRPEEAQRLYEQALGMATEAAEAGAMGPNAPRWTDILPVLDQLADLHDEQGRSDDAHRYRMRFFEVLARYANEDLAFVHGYVEDLFRKAMRTDDYEVADAAANWRLERSGGPEGGLDYAMAEFDLARLDERRGREAEAAAGYSRALEAAEKELDDADVLLVPFLRRVAEGEIDAGRHREAEALLVRALRLADAGEGVDEFDLAASADMLADILEETGRHGEAEPLRRQALSIYEPIYGTPSWMVANFRHLLADNLLSQKDWRAALAAYAETLEAVPRDERITEGHYADSLYKMLLISLRRGDLDGIASSWARLVELRERVLGNDSPQTVAGKQTLEALRGMGAADAAIDIARDDSADSDWGDDAERSYAVEMTFHLSLNELISEMAPDGPLPAMLEAMQHQIAGETLAAEGHYQQAASEYEKALSIRIMNQGREDDGTRRCATRLSELYRAAGRPELADAALDRVGM